MEEILIQLTTCKKDKIKNILVSGTLYRCYMPNHWVALVSTALPIILCLMCTVLLLSHSCIYWGQWEQYDDMYYYSYNYRGSQDLYIYGYL